MMMMDLDVLAVMHKGGDMKKILLILLATFAFSSSHGQTDDIALQEALNGNYKKAFSMFKNRCNKNEAYACGMVAYFYNKGFGVEKNNQLALKYYKKGCALEDSDSCTILGYYYYKGQIVKKDIKKAKELLKKACKLGNKDACKYANSIK